MNSNLIPFSMRSKEEAREMGARGGVNSGESRREKKRLKEAFKVLLDMQDEEAMAGVNQTNAMAIALAMVKKAKNGDVQAGVFVRDTSGEKPVDETDIKMESVPVSLVEFVDSKGQTVNDSKDETA